MAIPEPPAADGSSPQQRKFDQEPPMVIDPGKRYTATMVTSNGTMVIALDPLAAPKTVNSFVFLARYHYYDGVIFHRIIPGFVLQGGDPTGTGTGGPGYKFDDELPAPGRYQIGSLAMANAGPNTNGSQFFIISGPDGVRLPPQYALFGAVVTGGDVVTTINALGTRSGKPKETGHDRVGDHRRGGLSTAPAAGPSSALQGAEPGGPVAVEEDHRRRPRVAPAPVGVPDERRALGDADHGQPVRSQGHRAVELLAVGILVPVAEMGHDRQLVHQAQPDGQRTAAGIDHRVGEHHGAGGRAGHHRARRPRRRGAPRRSPSP